MYNLMDWYNDFNNVSSLIPSFLLLQETVFVPYITAYIPKKEQERFNRGVISKLGFIKAQVCVSKKNILYATP